MADSLRDLIAHSAPEEGGEPQSLYDHANNVAEIAAGFAASFGSEEIARWLGWWHDAGKADAGIQAYLQGEGESRDHSSVGMLKGKEAPTLAPALCCAGHHGGLANATGEAGSLERRIERKKNDPRVQKALSTAEELLNSCAEGAKDVVPELSGTEKEQLLQVELWTRFVHSALVDADYLDTEDHFQPEIAELRTVRREMARLLDDLIQDQKNRFGEPESDVDRVRDEVYRTALEQADRDQGFFSMTVPTGGGKTRSAMAFALKHAVEHDLQRVIVALPYTTIIDQNADEYRKIFGEKCVLEDHSATGRPSRPQDAETPEERRKVLSAENWDVPIITTTTVQLLETLFSNQNHRLRKLHRYARSVIILDEVQTIPAPIVEPTLWALRELTRRYRASVVLCTATQPGYGPVGHYRTEPIISNPSSIYKPMQRVEYDDKVDGEWSPERVAEEMETAEQALTVCNTTRDAERVARAADAHYLSTRLCQAHRDQVLDRVEVRLGKDLPVHLAATQVVEAGVDISFPLVLRDVGPLDAIIQAAGRCNREGKIGKGRVVIFRLLDGKCPPPPYRTGRDIALDLLQEGIDLHHPNAARRYFEALYEDYPTDKHEIQQLRQRFRYEEVASEYRLIPDDTVSVVVDYEEGFSRLRDAAERVRALDYVPPQIRRQLQPYTVNLRRHLHEEAQERGLVTEVAPDLWKWASSRYDATYGLQIEDLSPRELLW
jgi:CRISPR-associated endonuclease/helicase Cas3